jgi:hypothetical protein
MHKALVALLLFAGAPGIAAAGTVAVPEPETLSLLAIGAAAVVVARWLKKK